MQAYTRRRDSRKGTRSTHEGQEDQGGMGACDGACPMISIDFWLQVMLLAMLFDILFGEPPASIHPVVWMGKMIGLIVSRAPSRHRRLYGFFMAGFCVGIAVLAGWVIASMGKGLTALIVSAFFLKSSFSIRMLLVSALNVKKDIEAGRIEKVRG